MLGEIRKPRSIGLMLVVAVALALGAQEVMAWALANPKMEYLEPEGEPWMTVGVGENAEFWFRVYGEDNRVLDVTISAENLDDSENNCIASFDPENFTIPAGQTKRVKCTISPTESGEYDGEVIVAVATPPGTPGVPIQGHSSFSVVVHVPANRSPTVTASASPTSGMDPLEVSFSAIASDEDGYITSYKWDFGDGRGSGKQNPTHTFRGKGVYDVTVTVTDNGGKTASDSVPIKVLENENMEAEWVPYTPTPDMVEVDIENEKAVVKITFPNAGYRVDDWVGTGPTDPDLGGWLSRSGTVISAGSRVKRWTGGSAAVITKKSHTYSLDNLPSGSYTFVFKAWGVWLVRREFTIEGAPSSDNVEMPLENEEFPTDLDLTVMIGALETGSLTDIENITPRPEGRFHQGEYMVVIVGVGDPLADVSCILQDPVTGPRTIDLKKSGISLGVTNHVGVIRIDMGPGGYVLTATASKDGYMEQKIVPFQVLPNTEEEKSKFPVAQVGLVVAVPMALIGLYALRKRTRGKKG